MDMDALNSYVVQLAAFELPVPDLALILVAAFLISVLSINARNRQRKAVGDVATAYVAELTRVSRQAQSAEVELKRVRSDLEKERRRNRRSR